MPEKNAVILLFGTRLLSALGIAVVLPVLPRIAASFHLSATQAGWVLVSFTIAEAVMTPVAGVLSDRFGRKIVLMPALLVFALGGILGAFARTLPELIACRVLQGLGAGPLGVLYTILAADMYDDEHLPRVMGLITATGSIATVIFPIVGGILGEWNQQWPFWTLALALPVAALGLTVPLKQGLPHMDWRAYAGETRKIIANRRALDLFILFFLGYGIMYGPMNAYFPMMAELRYHASPSRIGVVFSLVAAGSFIASDNLTRLHKKGISFHKLMLTGALCYLISMIWLLSRDATPSLWWCAPPLLINGAAQGLTIPIINDTVATLAPSGNRAAVLAVSETFVRSSQSASPPVFGLGWSALGWTGPYLMGIVSSLLMGAIMIKAAPTAAYSVKDPDGRSASARPPRSGGPR